MRIMVTMLIYSAVLAASLGISDTWQSGAIAGMVACAIGDILRDNWRKDRS